MSTDQSAGVDWTRLGRAAEHFARRVARDARAFAEQVEEHTGAFARDVTREWSCGRGARDRPEPDLRRIFDDVRGVLSGVLDGLDELVTQVFNEPTEQPWARVVSNRDATCERCGNAIAAGSEAHVRRTAAGTSFRCTTCGTA